MRILRLYFAASRATIARRYDVDAHRTGVEAATLDCFVDLLNRLFERSWTKKGHFREATVLLYDGKPE